MWNRKELKKKARETIKKNLWTILFVGFLMVVVFSESVISRDTNNNMEILNQFIQALESGEEIKIIEKAEDGTIDVNQYIDEVISNMLFDSNDGSIRNINEEYGVTHGVFYSIFSFVTRGKMQLRNTLNSIVDYTQKLKFTQFVVMISSMGGLLVKIFIINPIMIGEDRMFLENRTYTRTKIKRITFPFRKKRYFNVVKAVFRKNLYKALWDLTIIGGWIKTYSYKMVPFILAENPTIKGKDAIKISRKMMDGNKWNAFVLDLSFIGWHLLQVITFGLAGIWVNPYIRASYAELYSVLREKYIEDKNEGYELLNDNLLYVKSDLTKYPDEEKLKRRINYNINYRPSSIILFFFTFAFAGWIWEVLLYLFRDGILVNRGTSYGPWLPIYGFSCTAVILLVTRFKMFRKLAKYPFLMFIFIMVFATTAEYVTSWLLETISGLKYWDYSGVFMNINGRVCLECSLFFGVGGSLCLYIIAPFLEKQFEKLTLKVRISICLLLVTLFGIDEIYSFKHPHEGEGITYGTNFESQLIIEE